MSALNNSALIGASGSAGYQISRSVRLRSSASAYFNRTPAGASNRQTWTWSGWVKKSKLAIAQTLFSAGTATDRFAISFGGGDLLAITNLVASVTTTIRQTNAIYRDPSAWYHVVLAVDTTQATAANRTYLAVNGVQITSFLTSNDLALNYQTFVNNTVAHNINAVVGGTNYVDGYITEINFIDGQALTPSSFGEFNSITGVWQPKKYAGTYGTNGFYLNFSDNSAATAAAIGKDYSGNGNNWTPNNISVTAGATYDSMIDTPTPYADGGNGRGNYAVVNPIGSSGISATIINGNLQVTTPGGNGAAYGSIAFPDSGNWYWEYTQTANASGAGCFSGISNYGTTQYVVYYGLNGEKYIDGINSAYGASYGNGDTIGVAVNVSSGQITFYKNNVSQGVIPYTFSNKTLFSLFADGSGAPGTVTLNVNFGQQPFTYTPPTGFKALNTQNLPASIIVNGAAYMAATTYAGTGATLSLNNSINNVSFQPDFVWIKTRTNAYNHALFDSVRGVNKALASNATAAEVTQTQGLLSFNSNGFTLGTSSDSTVNNAGTGQTYVGWQWKAGGAAVTNTAGSISSQVSANASAGFSVVTYTGTGANATVGHGLGVAPKFIIVKSRSVVDANWPCYHVSTGNLGFNYLNLNIAVINNAVYWNSTTPTSSVFSLGIDGANNQSSATFVAYCFAEVAGYSKFGSYVGNGSADGPFVYLGFRPRWLLLKNTGGAASWYCLDSSRNTYNVVDNVLVPNTSGAEVVITSVDFLSNGFKLKTTTTDINGSGTTYIYAAFAENPFKNALAR